MLACKKCNKRFRIKLDSKFFGIKLEKGYQSTCPYCGYVVYLFDIRQVRYLLYLTRMLSVIIATFLGMNARTLYAQERLIVAAIGVAIFVFVINYVSLYIACKMYDKLNK